MEIEELKQKISVIISATNTSGNEKRDAILELFQSPQKRIEELENGINNVIKKSYTTFHPLPKIISDLRLLTT